MKLKTIMLLLLLALFIPVRNYSVSASEAILADQIYVCLNHVTNTGGILMAKYAPIFGLNITYDSIMQGRSNYDVFRLKRLAEIDGYASSTMDSLVSSALSSQTMSMHWPDFQVGNGYAMLVYYKFIVNCYRWAQQYGQTSKWDINAAYQEFLTCWHDKPNFLFFNPGDGVAEYSDRYYDENAEVLTIFLKLYQNGVPDAMGPALQMWDHLCANHWSGSYFPYVRTSPIVECEAGNFAESIGELYVADRARGRNLPNFPDYLLKDLNYKFINNGDWSGKLWRNYVCQHAESNPELRLENTLAAWAALHSYYALMDGSMRADFVKLLTGSPKAWQGLVDNSTLYSNGQFGWRPYQYINGEATLAGMLILFLNGIIPDTGSLALPVIDERYQDIESEFPVSHLHFDYEARTIRIPVWAGNIKFIFGSAVASYNFTSDGIYEVQFSPDWNTVNSANLVSPLMSSQFSYLKSSAPLPEVNILSPQNTTYTVTPVPLTFTANESASWIGYTIDNQVNITISGNVTLKGLSVGQHSITVYANDTSGNVGSSETVYFSVTHPRTIIVPDDYPTIQEAINAATDGDTIFVRKGTYYEHLIINKSLAMIGEDRNLTIIDGSENGEIVHIQANDFYISDFTLQNAGFGSYGAVWVDNSFSNASICNNIMIDNRHGVLVESGASNVNVTGNLIYNRQRSYADAVRLFSSGTIVEGNTAINESAAISLDGAYNNMIHSNTVVDNYVGIRAVNSSYGNVFSENTISGNDIGFQIAIDNSEFYHNNIISNNVQAACSGLDNIWDSGYPSGGNYWSDYNGTDLYSGPYQNETASDGIADAPYIIDVANRDNYPFMSPWVPPPNIEIVSVKASKNVVGQGFSLSMNVTVANLGSEVEGFNMSVFWNSTVIQTQYITLAGGKSTTAIFQLNSTGWMKGNYTICAYAWPVPGEVDTIGNNLTGGWVVVAIIGDITGPVGFPDGKIDVRDVAGICSLYGFKYPDPRYANWDITGPTLGLADGKIDVRDVSLVASRYGQKDP